MVKVDKDDKNPSPAEKEVKSEVKTAVKKEPKPAVKAEINKEARPVVKPIAKPVAKATVKKEVSSPAKEATKPDPKSTDEVTKIIVDIEDEITTVLERIEDCASKRVVISIPASSALLISSVGMKLIAQKSDEVGKDIVIVTDDSMDGKVAKIAGLIVKSSMNDVDEQTWIDVQNVKVVKDEELKKEELKKDNVVVTVPVSDEPKDDKSSDDKMVGDKLGLDDSEASQAQPEKVETEKVETEKKPEQPMNLGREKGVSVPVVPGSSEVRKVNVDGFEMTIDSGPVTSKPKKGPVIKQDLGHGKGLIGRDFSGYEGVGRLAPSKDSLPTGERGVKPVGSTSVSSDQKKGLGKLLGALNPIKLLSKLKGKSVLKLLIPLVVVVVAGMAFASWRLPEVIVEIDVESIPVAYEGQISASLTVDDFDEELLVIPAKQEVVSKNGSDSTAATGTASRGEKAGGTITIYNNTEEEVILSAGTVLSNGGLTFVLQGEVVVPKKPDDIGMGSTSGEVLAGDFGSEYNVESGTTFTVGTYALGAVKATNAAVFTGGTKEDYLVVSQVDIDQLAESIKTSLFEEAKTELMNENAGSRWTFVEQSILSEIDGEVSSDVPAGAESDAVNVSLGTKSTALYYNSSDLDKLIENLLLNQLDEDERESVQLSEDIQKDISIVSASVADGVIVLNLSISGYVMPHLDSGAVQSDLKGRSWADGLKYLKGLDYISGDAEVDFYPEWMPEFMWRWPSSSDMITVKIDNVVPGESDESVAGENGEAVEGGDVEEPAE